MGIFDFLLKEEPKINTDEIIKENSNYVGSNLKIKIKEYKRGSKLPDNFIVFDLETTGLNAMDNEIIEIGAIKFQDNIEVERFHTYVKPDYPISSNITKINGITNSMVKDAPQIENAIKSFKNFIGNFHLIAHNASFDMGFIQTNMNHHHDTIFDNTVIDTLSLARKYMDTPNHKLETLKKYLKVNVGSHNAIDDCIVCGKVYLHCKEKSVL